MTRNKSGSLAKCMSPESPRRRTWKWNMSLTLQKVEDLLFFVTLNFPIDTWSARAARWTRARDAFPLPPPLSRILSPNFLCCLRIYQLIRIRVLRSYFDDSMGYQKGVILCVHKMEKMASSRPTFNIFKSDFPFLSDHFRPSGTERKSKNVTE